MARIRSVKPALRTSQVVASWPREVRYFFVLFWGYLDDEGRGLDVPKTIAGDCFPHDDDVTPAKIHRWLDLMAKTKLDPNKPPPICRYEVGGRRLVHCLNWGEHQRPNRPTPSVIAPCPVHEPLTESSSEPDSEPPSNPHGGSIEDALSPPVLVFDSRKLTAGEVDSRGGPLTEPPSATPGPTGSTPEPPSRCPKHLNDPNPPPCGPCGDARRNRETWELGRTKTAAAVQSDRGWQRAETLKTAIAACRLCDSTGYVNGYLCTHDPRQTTRATQGVAAARAAVAKKPTTEPETTTDA